ncbi:MAG: hypothetical protein Q9183_006044 [Haloplaca sp. 2 TL-2023]
MVSRKKPKSMKATGSLSASTQGGSQRQRRAPAPTGTQIPPGTKQINAGPLLDSATPGHDPDRPLTVSRAIGITAATIQNIWPALISWSVTVALIFGADGTQVFALETIVK